MPQTQSKPAHCPYGTASYPQESPRERRTRIGAHQPSAKLSKRQFAVQDNAVETVEIGFIARQGQDILASLNEPPTGTIPNKKEKQQLKHEAFIDRTQTRLIQTQVSYHLPAPYSKAQRRRFNRKQREQVGGGLGAIEAAISALDNEEVLPPDEAPSDNLASQQRSHAKTRPGLIGEGKGVPLTKAQRKRVLETEKFRHPLILKSSHYASNPFQTIRTHAQNTLEKHVPPN
ncbi:ribosome biogenesis protein SLX9-domain-containing protein [Chiua virens]|nr:ribosome biogenesis protein SLX9-domain-containing protein [Chiua virens]